MTALQVKQTHMERYNNYKQRTSDSTSSETNTLGALQIIINNEQVTANHVKQTHMERYNNYKQRTSDSTSSETNTFGAL